LPVVFPDPPSVVDAQRHLFGLQIGLLLVSILPLRTMRLNKAESLPMVWP
jgi:hypothetical protein